MPDGGPGQDGAPNDGLVGDSKLLIEWETAPAVPGLTRGGSQLEEVRFRMENFKATVDVDPNDPNTTRPEIKLAWKDGEAPEALELPNVPAGRYTSIVMKLDEGDNEDAFDIRGVASNGDTFRIIDTASSSISMACNIVLLPGETKTLVVDIDLETPVDAVDIQALEPGSGAEHHLDADDLAMVQFRTRLRAAFSVRER